VEAALEAERVGQEGGQVRRVALEDGGEIVKGLVVSAQLYIGLSHITITQIRIEFKHTLFFR